VTGALVVGADYRALGVVRSLGRHGIPVWVLRHGDDRLAAASRYAKRTLPLPDGDAARLRLLLDLPLEGWTLFPSSDETAALVARNHEALAARYRLTTPPWQTLEAAYDKRLTHVLATETGVPHPLTWYPRDRDEVAELDVAFPVVVKPAVKEGFNALTAAKAWRVDDRPELVRRYDEAAQLIDPLLLTVQEVVPGGGDMQLSFATLCEDGRPLASVTARRTRQFPMDFGRASTYVETIDEPEVVELAHRLLARLRWTGLIEIEFKRDARDGQLKLLDLNARVWGWHTLGARAGIDFSYLAWRLANGESVQPGAGRVGVRWMRLATDLPTALKEMRRGRLAVPAYVRSLLPPRESAIFARDDPLPGLLELPLLVSVLARRLARGGAV
jgi:D-aspartate ligase